ncbi:hypothetical protein MBLNU459_g4435t2 [Dothideomycetes sp. NU459]
MPSQAEYNAQTTIGSQDAGYIHEDELLALLIKKFPATEYPNFSGAEKDRFHIQVHAAARAMLDGDKAILLRCKCYSNGRNSSHSGRRRSFSELTKSLARNRKTTGICYDLRYIEANGRRAPRDPFSMRHTGVCHQYDPRSKSNVAIILHPMPESRAEKRLKALSGPSSPGDHPLNIHFLILSSYLSNWQAYIETLAEQFMGLRERVLAIDLERAQSHLQPDTLATLRNLEDKISFRTLSGLKGAINTINMLLEFNERLLKDNSIEMREYENAGNVLTAYVEKMESHVSSVEVMEKRIVATIGSLSSLLELKNQSVDLRNQTMALENQAAALENQAAADRLNEMMLKYTRESVDDNTTVKLITVFTLVYLPASFIASLLGMNLFDYDNNSGRFLTSPDLWVFFILAVPLTILTLGLGWYFDRKGRQAKHKRQSEKSGLP